MSFNSSLNPNVVKTALDKVFQQEINPAKAPGLIDATNPRVFKQQTSSKAAEIMEVFGGIGEWLARGEEGTVELDSPKVGNQKTFTHTAYARGIDIPKHFFDDDQHGTIEMMTRDFARAARVTRDKNAFAVFRNAFTTATTSDGVALCSNSHVTTKGVTVDNLASGALSTSTLKDALVQMRQMKNEAGLLVGDSPSVLLVPSPLYDEACQITKSTLLPGVANNDMNPYSSIYNLTVVTSPFLDAVSGGSDSAWFLLSDSHSIMRYVRKPVETAMIDWTYSRNNSYNYKGEFRETVGAVNYFGIVGSTGV